MTVLMVVRRYRCEIRGKRLCAADSIRGKHGRYCRDLDACLRRNKRANRKQVA